MAKSAGSRSRRKLAHDQAHNPSKTMVQAVPLVPACSGAARDRRILPPPRQLPQRVDVPARGSLRHPEPNRASRRPSRALSCRGSVQRSGRRSRARPRRQRGVLEQPRAVSRQSRFPRLHSRSHRLRPQRAPRGFLLFGARRGRRCRRLHGCAGPQAGRTRRLVHGRMDCGTRRRAASRTRQPPHAL